MMLWFAADMNRRSKTVAAFIWSFFERIGTRALRSVFAIVLARLLLPKDFGLVAILSVLVGAAEVIVTSGFGTVLIRKKEVNHTDECAIFYFNVLLGVILTITFFCSAPYVAAFYGLPQLAAIGRVTSFNVLVSSLSVVQWALLIRKLDFLTQFKISIASVATSGTLGIVLAWRGFGVWSIVAQQLSGNILNVMLLWMFAEWRPFKGFHLQSLRRMFGFSSSFVFINLLDVIAGSLSSAIIGKLFTASEAGLYSRAKQMEEVPVMTTYSTASRPSLPLFAASQNLDADLAHRFRSVLTHLALINCPVVIGLGLLAKPLVLTLLTVKWIECVPLLRLLCGVGILFPLQRINLNLIIAKGQSTLFLQLEVVRTVMTVGFISAAGVFGVKAMIFSQIIAMAITWYLNSIWTGRVLGYGFWSQLVDVLPYALASCVMAGGMLCAALLPFGSAISLLIGQVLVGGCLYFGFCWVFNLSAFAHMKNLAKMEFARIWEAAESCRILT
jgi:teichuronic acid exporter